MITVYMYAPLFCHITLMFTEMVLGYVRCEVHHSIVVWCTEPVRSTQYRTCLRSKNEMANGLSLCYALGWTENKLFLFKMFLRNSEWYKWNQC